MYCYQNSVLRAPIKNLIKLDKNNVKQIIYEKDK